MGDFEYLLNTIINKGIKLISSFEGQSNNKRNIEFEICYDDIAGIRDLIKRLNLIFNNVYFLDIKEHNDESPVAIVKIIFQTSPIDFSALEEETKILAEAIEKDEYKAHFKSINRRHYSIKLDGNSDNDSIFFINSNSQHLVDMTYDEIINTLSKGIEEFDEVIITIDDIKPSTNFMKIIEWLYYNRRNGAVTVQTNSSNFKDIELVKFLRRYTRDFNVMVDFYGVKQVKEEIINNNEKIETILQDSIKGIENLLKFFPTESIHIANIITSINTDRIVEDIKFLYEELEIVNISLIYPEFSSLGCEQISEFAPSMYRVTEIMKELNQYILNTYVKESKSSLSIFVREVPLCFFNKIKGHILIKLLGKRKKPISKVSKGNLDYFLFGFYKVDECSKCLINKECYGIYNKTEHLIRPFIQPIDEVNPYFLNFIRQNFDILD